MRRVQRKEGQFCALLLIVAIAAIGAEFIPLFFIGIGFLIDLGVFYRTVVTHFWLIVSIVGGLVVGKFRRSTRRRPCLRLLVGAGHSDVVPFPCRRWRPSAPLRR